ncbi:MAG TPA: OmpA family protein, partial [Bacteroidia bacterium]|nr:OmpA family protein [Bacteroidia bacterium]
MKNIFSKYYMIPLLAALLISSCVPSRQYDELQAKEKQCRDEVDSVRSENRNLHSANADLSAQNEQLNKDRQSLVTDTTQMGTAMSRLNGLYGELNKSYDRLIANQDKMLAGSNAETKKLIAQLQTTQEELQKKEDALNEKQRYFDELNGKLLDRENKINELQTVLNKKDSAVTALKNSVNNALLGFKDNGLTVSVKNGKVYVSLEERLLFQSGSTVVDKKGEEALKQLAKVLEKNPDINVLIEGHTDNVPIASGPIKDNWDLSVMRATSVVKIMTSNPKVDAARLT